MSYQTKLLKYYPQFSKDYVLDELPMAQGWAYLAAGLENDGWLSFSGMTRTSDGFIAQEIDKLMAQAKHLYTK